MRPYGRELIPIHAGFYDSPRLQSINLLSQSSVDWRRGAESNRRSRFCRPLPCHLGTAPSPIRQTANTTLQLTRLIDLVEHSAVCEKLLLGLLPSPEHLIDGKQIYLWKLACVLRRHSRQ